MIYVLYVIGGTLAPHHSLQLFQLACEIAKRGSKREHFSWDDAEGVLSTDYSSCCLGGISGIVFTLEMECDEHKYSSRFIVREQDLHAEYDENVPWSVISGDFDPRAANAMNN